MKTKDFIQKVEDCSLPQTEWTHLARIKVALWYIYYHKEYFEALYYIKCVFFKYSFNNPNYKCMDRQNETVTTFWVDEIQKFVNNNQNDSIDELAEKIQETNLMNSKYILNFYTQEELDSYKAKAIYIQPTKSPAL